MIKNIIFIFLLFFIENLANANQDNNINFKLAQEIEKFIDERWFYTLTNEKKQKITEDVIRVIFKNLREDDLENKTENRDKYADFYNKEEAKIKDEFFSGFVGIGVKIIKSESDEYPVILSIMEDSPADGILLKQDIILSVNDKDLRKKSLIQIGKILKFNNNEKVILKIKRNNQILNKEITTKKINTKSVSATMKNEILIIKILFFTDTTYQEILDIVKNNELYFNKISDTKIPFIFDLRDNPGGYLITAYKIATTLFLSKGQKVASAIGRDNKIINDYISHNDNPILKNTIPIILINRNSASAAEVLASAIRENMDNDPIINEKIKNNNLHIKDLAKINSILIGENSHGKISIQEMIKISEGTIKFTVAKYYTANGSDIENTGLTPDVYIEDNRLQNIKNDKSNGNSDKNINDDKILNNALMISRDLFSFIQKNLKK